VWYKPWYKPRAGPTSQLVQSPPSDSMANTPHNLRFVGKIAHI